MHMNCIGGGLTVYRTEAKGLDRAAPTHPGSLLVVGRVGHNSQEDLSTARQGH